MERTASRWVHRKAEEEPIAELLATTTTPRGARLGDVQPKKTPLTDHLARALTRARPYARYERETYRERAGGARRCLD